MYDETKLEEKEKKRGEGRGGGKELRGERKRRKNKWNGRG